MITEIKTCDLRSENPLGDPVQYDAVSCFYVTEQASQTREEWGSVFANLASLVAPGGRLFLSAIGNTDHYLLYDVRGDVHHYPVPRLTEADFLDALQYNGFSSTESTVTYERIEGQESEGVHGVILVSAQKDS